MTNLIRIEIGTGLFELVDDLSTSIINLRAMMENEIGYTLPSVNIRDNPELPPNAYQIFIMCELIGSPDRKARYSLIHPGKLMVLNPDNLPVNLEKYDGIADVDPTYNFNIFWIEPNKLKCLEPNLINWFENVLKIFLNALITV